jgi:hypothetical protein
MTFNYGKTSPFCFDNRVSVGRLQFIRKKERGACAKTRHLAGSGYP